MRGRPRPHVSAGRDVGGEARANKMPTGSHRTDNRRIPVQTLTGAPRRPHCSRRRRKNGSPRYSGCFRRPVTRLCRYERHIDRARIGGPGPRRWRARAAARQRRPRRDYRGLRRRHHDHRGRGSVDHQQFAVDRRARDEPRSRAAGNECEFAGTRRRCAGNEFRDTRSEYARRAHRGPSRHRHAGPAGRRVERSGQIEPAGRVYSAARHSSIHMVVVASWPVGRTPSSHGGNTYGLAR